MPAFRMLTNKYEAGKNIEQLQHAVCDAYAISVTSLGKPGMKQYCNASAVIHTIISKRGSCAGLATSTVCLNVDYAKTVSVMN